MEIASFPVVIVDSVFLFHYIISLNKMASSSHTVAQNDFFSSHFIDNEDILSLYRSYRRFCILYSVFVLLYLYVHANYIITSLISGMHIITY